MENNQRPMSRRKTIQFLVILLIMVMATQMLSHRLGFGQTVAAFVPTADTYTAEAMREIPRSSERFMPGPAQTASGTLELKSEATIVGSEVKLRAICRWSNADAPSFEPLGDLTLMRLTSQHPYRSVSVEEIRQMLRDAGVNVAMIDFAGSRTCTVSSSSAPQDNHAALEQWIVSKNAEASPAGNGASSSAWPFADTTSPSPADQTAATTPLPAPQVAASPIGTTPARGAPDPAAARTLGQILEEDCATRLGVPLDSLQITFNPADDKIINLVEPQFRFNLTPVRVRDLGTVEWQVLIVAGGAQKSVNITAMARQWENQLIVARPIADRDVIRDSDLVEHRTLVDHLPDDPLITKAQTVGQQASRDLKPGTILTARLVDPVPLCKNDDLITVSVRRGNVELKTVARALDSGGYGQTIRVRDQQTSEIFDVVLTGPQEGRLGVVPEVSAAAAAARVSP